MILLLYFAGYFLLTFVFRSYVLYAKTGVNPFVLPHSDDAYGYVGRAFKLVMIAAAISVTIHAFAPALENDMGRITLLDTILATQIGWALLLGSLLWTLIAQFQMGASWRIGIDTKQKTELVQHGLFSLSRNPIFLGVRINLLGLLLVLPTTLSLAIFVAGELLMQIQVRLEELHLFGLHGSDYRQFQSKVRRWI